MDIQPVIRGDRDATWLVVRRGLAIARRLLRGPATKFELLQAVRADVGPSAYSDAAPAAELALKRDRAALKQHLGIEVTYDRRAGLYCLAGLGAAAWLDLPDDDLAAIALLYKTFAATGVEGERVRAFLQRIADLLPAERLPALRPSELSLDLREVDEQPVSARILEVVRGATRERRRLGFCYRSTQDDVVRYHEVEPHEIVLRRGHFYLKAYHLTSRALGEVGFTVGRMAEFRLQGMLDDDMLAVLPERLAPGPRPQKEYLLRYRLARPAIRHGVSRHFANMRVTLLPDGQAEVEAQVANVWEAVHTLLGYGENCVVLGGEEALRLMRRRVAAMARNYDLLAFELA